MENFNDNIQLFVIKAIEMFLFKQIIRLSENKVSIDALLEIAIKVKTIRTFSFKWSDTYRKEKWIGFGLFWAIYCI